MTDDDWEELRDRILADVKSTIDLRLAVQNFYKAERIAFRDMVRPLHHSLVLMPTWPFQGFPRLADLLALPTVDSLSRNVDFADSSTRATVWTESIPFIEQEASVLHESMEAALLAKLELCQPFKQGKSLTNEDLLRPDVVFHCSGCPYWVGGPVLYPAVLTHSCFAKHGKPGETGKVGRIMMEAGMDLSEKFTSVTDLTGSCHLSVAHHIVNKYQALHSIIIAAGETPPKTKEEATTFIGCFVCQDCPVSVRRPKTLLASVSLHLQ